MCIQIRSVRAPACRSVASPVVNGVLESRTARTMRLRIVGSCRGYGKFPEISPPEQAWHISQNTSGNVDLPQSPCPHCTDPLMPQRRTRPARPLVGLTSSSAAPSAATVEVAAAAAADELVGPKRRRATTLTRLLPTYAGVNATRERARPPPPPSRPPPPPLSLPTVARRHSRHRHCCRHPRSHLRRHCRRCRA